MSQNVVAERYALALYELAKEQNSVQALGDELRVVKKVVTENPAFITLLTSPNLHKSAKKKVMQEVFSEINPIGLNTLMLLIDRDRQSEIADIAESFIQLANEELGVADATVHSVRALSAKEIELVSATFAAKVGKRSLNIVNIVDADMLGGLKIRIGNRIFDGSLRGKLDRLQRTLTT